jgi:hypothetical protein
VGGRYAFRPFKDTAKEELAGSRLSEEKTRVATLIADGAAAIRTPYTDGGQHPSFLMLSRRGDPSVGVVSRPEALAFAIKDIVVIRGRAKPPACGPAGCPSHPDQPKHAQHPALIPQGATIATLKTTVTLSDADPSAFALPVGSHDTVPLSTWSLIAGAAHIVPGAMQMQTRFHFASQI